MLFYFIQIILLKMQRVRLTRLAAKVEKAITDGLVITPTGTRHAIGESIDRCLMNTQYYSHEKMKKLRRNFETEGATLPDFETVTEFKNAYIVDAIFDTVKNNPAETIAALNFASPKNPGGGWYSGAVAQEESLARSSALVISLKLNDCLPFYSTADQKTKSFAHEEQLRNGLIYSHEVPFFVGPDEKFCEPVYCSVISCAAVNRNSKLVKTHLNGQQVEEFMNIRIRNVLAVALQMNVSTLLLGAWGTGVFGNDVGMIARLFWLNINQTYRNCFAKVIFAIPDVETLQNFRNFYR